MFSSIYIENDLRKHPRVREILQRFPNVPHISCEHYSELFNRNQQNFRLQKKSPSLILAEKHNRFVLPAPPGYGIGDQHNYYFSHMLNCLYDCRYCFLQGMYKSAHYVLFANYESFASEIEQTINRHIESNSKESICFFSGYDCDSLALEPVSHFADYFLDVFAKFPQAMLELRTKSTQVRGLLAREPLSNCVVAFSFTPENISNSMEHKVPTVKKRLDALARVQEQGWKIGLRFDPVIYTDHYQTEFADLCQQVFSVVDASRLHSVSLGAFRMPRQFMSNIIKLYPDDKLFSGEFERRDNMMSYPQAMEQQMLAFCEKEVLKYISKEQLFNCDSVANT